MQPLLIFSRWLMHRRNVVLPDPDGPISTTVSPGFTSKSMRRIILPQAARVILPPTGNEFNNMLKSTSLASVIAIKELLQSADDLNHLYFRTLETFAIVSCYYLAMTTLVTWLQSWMESRLGERKAQSGQGGFWTRVRMNVLSRRGAISDHR